MITLNLKEQEFCIVDYFLNGYFLNSKTTSDFQDISLSSQIEVTVPQSGGIIFADVIGIEAISEDEYRVLLATSDTPGF